MSIRMLALSVALWAAPLIANAFCLDQPDSICHRQFVSTALPFLRGEVMGAIIKGITDADFGIQGSDTGFHFDECDFEGGANVISSRFEALVSENMRPLNAINFFKGLDQIGELLHPVQDFYSHSNWLQIQHYLGRNDLLHGATDAWPSLTEWRFIGDSIVILSGNDTFTYRDGSFSSIPEGWSIQTPSDSALPNVSTPNGTFVGLITGSVDSTSTDCPPGADFTHNTLQKDNFARAGDLHCEAAHLPFARRNWNGVDFFTCSEMLMGL